MLVSKTLIRIIIIIKMNLSYKHWFEGSAWLNCSFAILCNLQYSSYSKIWTGVSHTRTCQEFTLASRRNRRVNIRKAFSSCLGAQIHRSLKMYPPILYNIYWRVYFHNNRRNKFHYRLLSIFVLLYINHNLLKNYEFFCLA